MKLIGLYDTETCNLDLETFVQEIAWAVFAVCPILNTWRSISTRSAVLSWSQDYEGPSQEVEEMTGLSKNFAKTHGKLVGDVFADILKDTRDCEFIAGQNILAFDNPRFETNVKRVWTLPETDPLHFWRQKKFIDTYYDLPLPKNMKRQSLKYMALDHGYVLTGAHEAMQDVFACAHIMSKYPLEKIIEISSTPLLDITVRIPYGDQKTKDRLYKIGGFRWNPDLRLYQKKIREFFFKESELEGMEWAIGPVHPRGKVITPVLGQEELTLV